MKKDSGKGDLQKMFLGGVSLMALAAIGYLPPHYYLLYRDCQHLCMEEKGALQNEIVLLKSSVVILKHQLSVLDGNIQK